MERSDDSDVVIGAGVFGLAIARALTQRGRNVIVIERNKNVGEETSSRNSGVIHAGLYYPPESLKALFCVVGNRLLYRYAEEHGVPFKRCGKLVVATSEDEIGELIALQKRAQRNGVRNIILLEPEAVREMEPALRCVKALYVPSSGLIDSAVLLERLQDDIMGAGADIAFNSRLVSGDVSRQGLVINVTNANDSNDIDQIRCRTLTNAGGLWAQDIAKSLHGLDPATIPKQLLAKGSYFRLSGRQKPFNKHLVYPVPMPGKTSGLHMKIGFGGEIVFGPDYQEIDSIDPGTHPYNVDPKRAAFFANIIRSYWPDVNAENLEPDYAGVRPKLQLAPGDPHNGDFVIDGPRQHGIPGLFNLFGIESPGLTVALATAEALADVIEPSPPGGGWNALRRGPNPLLYSHAVLDFAA
jgi:L-2-hydroxyglutarate oxidase LhgO